MPYRPVPDPEHVHVEASPGLEIPDAEPAGISSQITVGAAATITALSVTVDIQHTFIGDLRVSLVSPGGATIVLHSETGGGADDSATGVPV